VATFRFHHWVDTSRAEFKLDNGPALPAQSVALEAAALGAQLWTDNITNASDGRVSIPLGRLAQAQTITIRPNPRARPRSFTLSGLHALGGLAQTRGCTE
jgi:hypothetical protein